MKHDAIEIGYIKTISKGKQLRSTIEVWPGYGVTCDDLGTLNGNITRVAEGLKTMVDGQERMREELSFPEYGVQVVIGGVVNDCQDVEKLRDTLIDLYNANCGESHGYIKVA